MTGIWPTPLVKLRSFGEVWAKLEFFNVLSRSIKDRVAYHILTKLLQEKQVSHVLDATSGNFGLALALLGNVLGVRVTIVLPRRAEQYAEVLLRVAGAEIVHAPIEINDERMINFCRQLSETTGATFLNQFENDLNPEAHYLYTGRELVEQLRSANIKPDVLVVALGTSGHAAGVSRALREYWPDLYVIGVASRGQDYIPGIKNRNTYRKWVSEVNEVVEVSLSEAIQGVLEVARREGLLIGLSSGAVIYALLNHVMPRLGRDKVYVLVFPDDLLRYTSILVQHLSSDK